MKSIWLLEDFRDCLWRVGKKQIPHNHGMNRILSFVAAASFFLPAQSGRSEAIDFNQDIRPILSDHCFACHGPDSHKRKGGKKGSGGLRLDNSDGTQADLGGYAAVVPGKPDVSELVARILNKDTEEIMPPPDFHKSLSASQN